MSAHISLWGARGIIELGLSGGHVDVLLGWRQVKCLLCTPPGCKAVVGVQSQKLKGQMQAAMQACCSSGQSQDCTLHMAGA